MAQGSVNVFVRNGATWTQQQKLTAADGAASDCFGNSVAISGDTVVVGAYLTRHRRKPGSRRGLRLYAQRRDLDSATEAHGLRTARQGDRFGSVAISGDTVVVGAEHDIGGKLDQGAAYVFARNGSDLDAATEAHGLGRRALTTSASQSPSAATRWWSGRRRHRRKRVKARPMSLRAAERPGRSNRSSRPRTARPVDLFGDSVAISGDTVVVGASFDDIGGNSAQGSAYIFERSGATWTQQQKLHGLGRRGL